VKFTGTEKEKTAELICGVIGKHAVYFEFLDEDADAECTFDRFTFD